MTAKIFPLVARASRLACIGLIVLCNQSVNPATSQTLDWQVPIASPAILLNAFRSPNSDYSAGHRGVDYLVSENQSVLAASAGVVTFSGRVALKQVVVIQHANGYRTAYEPVCPALTVGSPVTRGQVIGTICSAGYSSHCAPEVCLHFSLRHQDWYLSPLALIGGLAPSSLIPVQH